MNQTIRMTPRAHRHPTPEDIRGEIIRALNDDYEAHKDDKDALTIPVRTFRIIDAAISRACDKHDMERLKGEVA